MKWDNLTNDYWYKMCELDTQRTGAVEPKEVFTATQKAC